MLTFKIAMFVVGVFFIGIAVFSYPQSVKDADMQTLKTKVKNCFDGVNWARESFIVSGERLTSTSGENTFYGQKTIDEAIKKLNKVLED